MRVGVMAAALGLALGPALAGAGVRPLSCASAHAADGEAGNEVSAAERRGPPQQETEGVVVARLWRLHQAQVAVGTLAARKGSLSEVRRLGELLVADHGRASRQVAEYVEHHGVVAAPSDVAPTSVPLHEPPSERLARLERLQGRAFDRAFLETTVAISAEALNTMRAVERDPVWRSMRGVAGRLEPILHQHAEIARELATRLGLAEQSEAPPAPQRKP